MVKQSSVGAKTSFNGLQGLAASALVLALTGCVSGTGSSSTANQSGVPAINEADRVLWLTLNETNASDVADSSSYRHTVVGSAETSSVVGIAGNARSFANDPNDEVNSYIKVADANSLDLTGALSIEAWLKPSESGQSSFIVAKNQGWNVNMAYALALHKGAIEVLLADFAYQTDYMLAVDEWTHVATTWDGSVLRVFANGIQIYRKNNVTDVIVANEYPVLIGARNRQATVSETKSFTGTIDEVSVYRVALLPSQVCVEAGRTWESGTCSGGAFGGATPVATSTTYAIDAESALTSQLVATDADSAALIYTLGEIGAKGHITITNPTTGAFTYTPDPMAEGADQFTFYATDGVNRSEAATVTITMTRANLDTDGDGMFDHIERTYGLNPNSATDAATDLDGDGVSNFNEVIAGSDPTISNTVDETRVLAFGFSEGTGLAAYDHSGSGNNATLDRPRWVVGGPAGSALEFHGADAIAISDSASLDITSALTVSAWINPEVADQQSYILAKNYGWTDQMAYALSVREGKLRVVFNGEFITTSNAVVPAGEWSHVAVTWDGTTVIFYVNGTLAATAAYSGTLTANAERLIIGGRNRLGTGRSELFTGAIDQVHLWNAALNNEQVCRIYGGTLDGTTCAK